MVSDHLSYTPCLQTRYPLCFLDSYILIAGNIGLWKTTFGQPLNADSNASVMTAKLNDSFDP